MLRVSTYLVNQSLRLDPGKEVQRIQANKMAEPEFYLHAARSQDDLQAVVGLFTEYATWLGIDLSFQDFDAEMEDIPNRTGKYAPPDGELLLARHKATDEVVGVVGLKPLGGPQICEMKRLWVPSSARGLGIGKALVDAIIDVARKQGYEEMRLDSLDSMKGAQRLYTQVGFTEIEKYYDTPNEQTVFMSLKLR